MHKTKQKESASIQFMKKSAFTHELNNAIKHECGEYLDECKLKIVREYFKMRIKQFDEELKDL